MNISQEYINLIAHEFTEVEKMMKGAKTPADLLYYFSASFGVINRVMNFHEDPTLVFIHQGLQALHQSLQGRLSAIRSPADEHMIIPPEFLVAMTTYTSEMRDAIVGQNIKQIYLLLEKIANLTYAATGNGYYLYLGGKIKI